MFQTHRRPKRTWISFGCLLLSCLTVLGCSRDSLFKLYGYDRVSLLKKSTPQEDETLARDCVDVLLQDRFDEIEARLDPNLGNADSREKLAEMASYFPSKPISVKTVEVGVVRGRDSSTTSLTLEYQFPQSWLLAHVAIQSKTGVKTITEFRVTPTTEPFEIMNEFTLADKGFSQYAGLLLLLSVATLTLYAFVLCVRMKIGGKKWVWLAAILIGVCRITVNWTTGEWSFTPLALNVPPVQAVCTPYGPWMLKMFSPIGAIAFLRLRNKLASLPVSIVPDAGLADERQASTSD